MAIRDEKKVYKKHTFLDFNNVLIIEAILLLAGISGEPMLMSLSLRVSWEEFFNAITYKYKYPVNNKIEQNE